MNNILAGLRFKIRVIPTVEVDLFKSLFFLDGQANAPHIKMLSSDLIIGEPILFECNVEDSNPPPVLKWDSPSSDSKIESKVF